MAAARRLLSFCQILPRRKKLSKEERLFLRGAFFFFFMKIWEKGSEMASSPFL